MADEVKKIPVVSGSTNTPAVNDPQFDEIKSELFTRFELLPDDIKKAITDDNYQTKLFNIAKEQKMTYEELGMLETETTMVLLGMTKPEDYRDEIQLQLKKNDADIDVLVKKVNEQVFLPIRASLERVYAAKKEPADYIPESIVTGVVEKVTPVTPPTPSPTLSAQDKSVLEKTGVVINEIAPTASPIQASQVANRGDLLKSIENPPKAVPIGMVAAKLNTASSGMPTKSTDYSILKSTTTPPPATKPTTPGSDPYREPIK
jgi:hypothetical protein